MISEAEVRAVLNEIVDPCSAAAGAPAGLQDMGLIRKVQVEHGIDALPQISVVIAVTEFGCLMGAPFVHEAYERLAKIPGIGQVDIRLDDQFDWLPTDMAPAYRARLHAGREARQKTVTFVKMAA